ncbi:IS66 family insertion sequence element accessory protein TnpA [Pedobacter sp. NJ-S-72]
MNISEEKRSHMLSLVSQWRNSTQTQQEFCSFHGIKVGTFGYWISVSKEEKGLSGFREVLPKGITDQKIEITYPNGVKVHAGSDLNLIARLIHLY